MKVRLRSRLVLAALLLVAACGLIWLGCSEEPSVAPDYNQTGVSSAASKLPVQASDVAQVMAVQNRNTASLEKIEGVFGTAVGRDASGEAVILVLTDRPDNNHIPAVVEGVPTRRLVTDRPELFAKPDKPGGGGGGGGKVDLKSRADRPVPMGYSLGNYTECASGTLGAVVYKGGNPYILSNNHVLARQNAGSPGEPIGQPGLYDNKPQCSGYWADTVGHLTQFVTVQTGANANNTVDAAIAATSFDMVQCTTPNTFYGQPNTQTVEAALDLPIQKVGRTTALTTGTVIGINATVTITYAGATTRFVDQVLTSSGFSKAGDSGSLIVTNDANANPVALLFAGNRQGYTWGNRIQNVLQALNISICGK
ncbi:MAG: hypothetical protein PVH24_07330 [Candidatus Zixiibacteriota bacterium]|jgi:hypothetical protein